MAQKDREKWDQKYADMPDLLIHRPPAKLVEEYYHTSAGKSVLDVACGGGRHTIFLSKRGFFVDAVDISPVALEKLALEANENVSIIEADLDTFTPQKQYDLVIMTNFLDRDLIERIKSSLKEGALFIIETYMQHPSNEKKDANPLFLLQPKELLEIFKDGYEVLAYEESDNETYEKNRMKKEAIAVRKC